MFVQLSEWMRSTNPNFSWMNKDAKLLLLLFFFSQKSESIGPEDYIIGYPNFVSPRLSFLFS